MKTRPNGCRSNDPIDRQRRELLALAAALPALGMAAALPAAGTPALLGCCFTPENKPAVAIVSAELTLLALLPLPSRGHGIAISPDARRAVVFARRPGREATIIDLESLRIVHAFSTPADRHLYGHGFFSPDGKTLYTTENDFDRPGSVLARYDATQAFQRLGEADTGGIGVHEAILLADGETVAVANGGIETHPDFPRAKLNIVEMAPSLAYLRRLDGHLLEQHRLPDRWHQVSLRHIAQSADGAVWVGGQFEGTGSAPLIARHERGGALQTVDAPGGETSALAGYVGSVAANENTVLFTSPRGGQTLGYDRVSGETRLQHTLADVCGAVRGRLGIALSSGTGELLWLDGARRTFDLAWDNHLVAVNPTRVQLSNEGRRRTQ